MGNFLDKTSIFSLNEVTEIVDNINAEIPEAQLEVMSLVRGKNSYAVINSKTFTANDADMLQGILGNLSCWYGASVSGENVLDFYLAYIKLNARAWNTGLKAKRNINIENMTYKIKSDGSGAYFYNKKKVVTEVPVNSNNLQYYLTGAIKTLLFLKAQLLPTIRDFNDSLSAFMRKTKAINMRIAIEFE